MSWRVLIVEDDPLTRALIRGLLGEFAAQIAEFDAAEPALAALLAEPFDLLITDIRMPGARDGLWLLNETRRHFEDLPIIVITGTPPEDCEFRAADVVVIKPFHPDELLGEALELLGDRRPGPAA